MILTCFHMLTVQELNVQAEVPYIEVSGSTQIKI